MNHDIKETTELVAAGAAIYEAIARTGSDNLLRLGLELADDVPLLVAGLHGAQLVPAELADLSEQEADLLQQRLNHEFLNAETTEIQEALKASAAATLAGVVAVRKWREAIKLKGES